MKTAIQSISLFLLFLISLSTFSQDIKVKPSSISKAIYFDKIGPIRDLPSMTEDDWQNQVEKAAKKDLNKGLGDRIYPFAESALPKGPDQA